MRTLNRPDLHTGTANHSRRRSTRTGVRASQRSNIELASDGVLASYIHDISGRHRRNVTRQSWSDAPH
jgi:hypothetical protein